MGKRTLFLVFHVSRYVYFWEKNLHFAPFCLSIWVAGSYFLSSNYLHLAPKTPLFNGHFVHFGRVFHGSDGFCLYRYSVFLCFSFHVLHHFTLHLAPFYLAFSTKTHCILHQNALCFAPKRTAFSGILHHILPKIAPNLVLMAVVCNKYSFCCIRGLTRFCPKINSRENRFFAARLAIGDENGAHNVKIYAEKLTKASSPTPLRKGKASPPTPLQKVKASPPTPLQGMKASPPTPLQGERGVICVVGWQGLPPKPSPKGESLTPDPSPRGEGGGMRCWLTGPHPRWCQMCGGLYEMGISVVADHIYNGKRDALCCYG